MSTEDYALVKCSRCGEFSRVAWELLGENKPEEIEGYICGACEHEIDMAWSALQDRHLLEDGDDD